MTLTDKLGLSVFASTAGTIQTYTGTPISRQQYDGLGPRRPQFVDDIEDAAIPNVFALQARGRQGVSENIGRKINLVLKSYNLTASPE